MDVEHIVRSFPVDESLQKQVQALESEGYQIVPGIPPVIVYHLARPKKEQPQQSQSDDQPGALGKLRINDDLIMVIPAKDLPR
ncbi:MAG: hypothetical protein WAN06_14215 [Candidatus Sulfotelmatobacter sp.]